MWVRLCAWVCARFGVQTSMFQHAFRCLNMLSNVKFVLNFHFSFGIVIFFFIIRVLSVGKYPY